MNQNVHDTIIDLVMKHFGLEKEEVRLEHSFTQDYGANPSQLTDFFTDVQKAFTMQFPAEELPKLTTITRVIEAVEDFTSEW